MEIELTIHSNTSIESKGKCCLNCKHEEICAIYLAVSRILLPYPYTVTFDCVYYEKVERS